MDRINDLIFNFKFSPQNFIIMPNDTSESNIIGAVQSIKSIEKQFLLRQRVSFFEATGFEKQEIKHSRVLSYLLDPNKPHALGDEFFKELMLSATLRSKNYKNHAIKFITRDFDDLEVQTEWHGIDIYLRSRNNKLIIAIENKIDSSEHDNQLKRYSKKLEEFREKSNDRPEIIMLYLTPNEDEPSYDKWSALGYNEILNCLKSARANRSITPTSDTYRLVEEYINLIERKILMDDTELKEALEEIYNKHKDFFDIMMSFIQEKEDESSIASDILDEFGKILEDKEIKITRQKGKYSKRSYGEEMFGFAINDWEIKKCTNNKWFGERPQAPILWVFKSLITEDKDPSFNIYLEANKQWIKDQKIANPEFEEKFKQIQKELSDRHGFDIRTGSDYASGMFINKSIKISREKLENTSEAAKLIYDGVSEIFNKEKIDEIFKQIQQIIKPIIPTDNRSTEEDRDHSKSP